MNNQNLVGTNIKALRKQKGWNQETLAKKTGYADKSMISRIENGSVDLPQSSIMHFAEVFGVEPGALLSKQSSKDEYYISPETAKLAQELFDNPDMRMLFDAAKNSKPEDLQMAADMLKRFKEGNADG